MHGAHHGRSIDPHSPGQRHQLLVSPYWLEPLPRRMERRSCATGNDRSQQHSSVAVRVRRIFDGNPSWVRYYPVTPGGNAPANPPAEDTIYITWDNPYSGGNSYSSTAPSPYSISGGSVLDYNADNEMAVFTLSLPASSRVVTHRRHLPISPQHPREASSSSPTSRPIRATICS